MSQRLLREKYLAVSRGPEKLSKIVESRIMFKVRKV